MPNRQQKGSDTKKSSSENNPSPTPTISLPKGGGAIRGIGEKFAANPVTGTGAMSVPIAVSPGRSGFGPQLSLSYDSGSGNGPFGLGWNLSLPSITRKTDKGLPKYQDGEDSDTFILSGAEDLVPVLLEEQGNGWVPEKVPDRTIHTDTYRIKRYRPRIEGLFARIERWTNIQSNETHWRSISRDNIVTVYGRTTHNRIEDPNAPEGSPRVFSWFICESYDDKGNAIHYEYKPEDSAEITLSQTNELNRTEKGRSANRYLKRIKYGNKAPVEQDSDLPREFRENLAERTDWLFEMVFDYEEGHYKELPLDPNAHQYVNAGKDPNPANSWYPRQDPFSSYRSGFEVRTYRLCRRALMFHHFPDELGVDDYLVRSTEFQYKEGPIASFITSVIKSGYKRRNDGTYLKKSMPPLDFQYSKASIRNTAGNINAVENVDKESIENLPQGLDGAQYKWTDIDGEGLSGILTEQGDSWFYKRNISALPVVGKEGEPHTVARFAPTECLATIPSHADLSEGRQQLLDLAGDGQLDVVQFDSPTPGFYERTQDETWHEFKPFVSLPNISWQDPNLKFVDLTGDGHADILITEDETFTWYPSLAETGFAPGEKVRQALDEEKGPKLVFADGTQSIYLADFSGDGLTDVVRIRNGEVCYWPNLGYGRFGAKVTMDNSPHFDAPDKFDQRRIRLADIDGSGVTDIIYLKDDGISIYFNESGNSWSDGEKLKSFPRIDNLSSVMVVDLLGNGTACLVWSSPLPGDAGAPMRYIDLMGGQKPHLLIRTINNLGAETRVHYAPSTKFYLADKAAGKPWITRIPFPVHVVERVETCDHISRNRFVTRYAYHHGYFDGREREFRGFGMVEQWDTEEFAALTQSGEMMEAENIDAASHVPPVWTKTWFHTGIYVGRGRVSDFFAGIGKGDGEYFREPALRGDDAHDPAAKALLLPDTVLPPGLTAEEEREACRALKGSMLRQEVYALDGTDKERRPYTVTEQNFTIQCLQPRDGNRHAVFFTHAREAVNYHYERNPDDPRIQHALTVEVDEFGNVLKEAAIAYGRKPGQSSLSDSDDRTKQEQLLFTYTENDLTNPVDDSMKHPDNTVKYPHDYRTPLPCESRTYEVTSLKPSDDAPRFSFTELTEEDGKIFRDLEEITYEQSADPGKKQKRLIERLRTLYRPDDLGVSVDDPLALLPLGTVQPLALPGETCKLSFTPGLLTQVFQRNGAPLLPDPANVLGGQGADRGGYVDLDSDGHWWIPAGRVFHSPNADDTAAQEFTHARRHFFLPQRYRDPFGQTSSIANDTYDLLMTETIDALGNRVTADNDYRVLQPGLVTGPNGNRTEAGFDTLGLVAGTAVMGKPGENKGDSLTGFEADLTQDEIDLFFNDPKGQIAGTLLGGASTRIIYDASRYYRLGNVEKPVFAATIARETHLNDEGGTNSQIQVGFSYSDGFGREIQKKIEAEPGPLDLNDPDSPYADPRWAGSGWIIFNNKGKPVRQYEPFFDDTHDFRFGHKVGVSSVLFYDAMERVVATLHPNHTYEKVVFDPWRQETWDVNDTVAADPRTDEDISGFTREYFKQVEFQEQEWKTWLQERNVDPQDPPQDTPLQDPETRAAIRTLKHKETSTVAYFDTLGRPFLTIADNGKDKNNDPLKYETRVALDIEGNQRAVIDAMGRIVMAYDYDMLGNRVKQTSMDTGERWYINNVAGNIICTWDSREHRFRLHYDELQRATHLWVRTGSSPDNVLAERTVYGEGHPNAEALNLRGQVWLQLDGAGSVKNGGLNPETQQEEAFDFKSNPLSDSRRLAKTYKTRPDWKSVEAVLSNDPLNPVNIENELADYLEDKTFVSSTTYDALNRVTTQTTPDGSVARSTYNKANLLEEVFVSLKGGVEKVFVKDIDYDAKGQRTLIEYGNNVTTTYAYDPLTFRLTHLLTIRGQKTAQDCAPVLDPRICEDPPALCSRLSSNRCILQNLHYTYDPTGNITHIRDDAQQIIYFKNEKVEPNCDYVYDAIYRLLKARGREHLGQTGEQPNPPAPTGPADAPRDGLDHPGDGQAMGTYTEWYEYDAVGNILSMRHRGDDPAHPGWRRCYQYAHDSNRLLSTGGPKDPYADLMLDPDTKCPSHYASTPVYPNHYEYDAHGNMTEMPHLPLMRWDFEDQLQATSKQVIGNGGTPETTYYVYDADGKRVRKVTENEAQAEKAPTRKDERIYLGGLEVYREYDGNEAVALERETLHAMDDQRRIAMMETKTIDEINDESPARLVRYQHGNHLGSAILELDDEGKIISYEEYYPYGSTSYRAVDKKIKAAAKRYRYTGKEQDEETGLYYHGARYYACWLGRWTSVDPAGLVDGLNVYCYTRNLPVRFVDIHGTQTNASEGSVLNTIDRTFVQKNINYNTEIAVRIRIKMPNGKMVTVVRIYDRGFFENGKLRLLEAKGGNLSSQRTRDQAIADRWVQDYGGEVEVVRGAGKPPKAHGSSKSQQISFNRGQKIQIEPGSVQVVHGNATGSGIDELASRNMHIDTWKQNMSGVPDSPAAKNPDLVRVSKPGQQPKYVPRSSVKSNVGGKGGSGKHVPSKEDVIKSRGRGSQSKPRSPTAPKPPVGRTGMKLYGVAGWGLQLLDLYNTWQEIKFYFIDHPDYEAPYTPFGFGVNWTSDPSKLPEGKSGFGYGGVRYERRGGVLYADGVEVPQT